MADRRKNPEEKEIKIPVFSVLKKGNIIKKILLNNPQWELKPSSESGEDDNLSNQEDNPILIGRHPDCLIVLDHPSISRFHLEIRAKPALQKLSVTDRSSVHGTWVSGNKIQPNIPIDLMEGDTVKLGASTRVYRLQWIPLSTAFEKENPLPALLEDNEETHQLENLEWAEEIPSAPPMPESFSLPLERENQSPARKELGEDSPSFCSILPISEYVGSSLPMEAENRTPEKNIDAYEVQSEREYLSPLTSGKWDMPSSLLSRRSKSISFLRIQTGRNKKGEMSCNGQVELGNQKENGTTCEQGKREETFCRVLFTKLDGKEEEEEEEEETYASDKENMTPLDSTGQKLRKNHMEMQRCLNAFAILNLEDVLHSDKETWTPKAPGNLKRNRPISENCLKKEREEKNASDKENLTPEFSSGHKLKKSLRELQRSSLNKITALNVEEDAFHSDKENWTPEVPRELKSKKPLCRDLLQIDGEEEEAFPSDKENLTPEVSEARKSKKLFSENHARIEREMMERRKGRVPFHSLVKSSPSMNSCPLNHAQRIVDKERVPFQSLLENSPLRNSSPVNHAQRIVDKEKVPFQSLLKNSPLRNSSPVNHALRIVDEGNKYSSASHTRRTEDKLNDSSSQCMDQVLHKAGGEKKKWNMVVDTDCFLNEESRKSLQLLEGLKGTHLMIPRIVIRELDCLKRRESLFRKETKVASSVLQWIEECMVKSSWWIHVQSSSETMPVAPTPPATPRSQLCNGSDEFDTGASNSMAFSTCGSLMEIVSPTAEDHILDCALLFKRIRDDGQLVLLTNSITLKIKAMAEGLLCETPKEFRESLVNPYSKRFLWADSSPRGFTWSCLEEVGLIENYYHQFPAVRKTAKAAKDAKGLKLILLHNSDYGKTKSVK